MCFFTQIYFPSLFLSPYIHQTPTPYTHHIHPQLQQVLVNGPGTCVPICAAALLLRLTHLHDTRIAYVESIARVQSLSLSGKVLYYSRVADVMLVQWPEMAQRYPRCRYVGRLM